MLVLKFVYTLNLRICWRFYWKWFYSYWCYLYCFCFDQLVCSISSIIYWSKTNVVFWWHFLRAFHCPNHVSNEYFIVYGLSPAWIWWGDDVGCPRAFFDYQFKSRNNGKKFWIFLCHISIFSSLGKCLCVFWISRFGWYWPGHKNHSNSNFKNL